VISRPGVLFCAPRAKRVLKYPSFVLTLYAFVVVLQRFCERFAVFISIYTFVFHPKTTIHLFRVFPPAQSDPPQPVIQKELTPFSSAKPASPFEF